MEYIPVQILEENEAVKKLTAHHVYSVGDLKRALELGTDSGINWSKENERVLREKVEIVSRAVKEGVDEPRNLAFVETFHSIPGVLLSLNGVNLVAGKRGTGKTTLAFVQMLDAFIELHQKSLAAFLDGSMTEAEFVVFGNHKILFFNMREVFNYNHFNALITEKARKFVEKQIESKKTKPSDLDDRRSRFSTVIRNAIVLIPTLSWEELKTMLGEIIDLKHKKETIDVFGIIFDDLSFLFNRIDSMTIKTDVRNFAKICNQLVLLNHVPVIVTDSVRSFYDDDTFEDLRFFIQPIFFSSVSDIFYLTKSSDHLFKVTQLKSSKELISVETRPS